MSVLEAEKLKQFADDYGVIGVLSAFTPNVRIRIPMSKRVCETLVSDLALATRATNGMLRNDIETVGDIVEIMMTNSGLESIRNLGKKSVSEIKTTVLSFAYENLSDNDKLSFWQYVLSANVNAQ